MGKWYTFTCPGCGYTTEASGGADRGEAVEVQTVSCPTCRELHDAITREYGHDVRGGNIVQLRCPECEDDKVVAWNQGDPCPRCGQAMPPGQLSALWD